MFGYVALVTNDRVFVPSVWTEQPCGLDGTLDRCYGVHGSRDIIPIGGKELDGYRDARSIDNGPHLCCKPSPVGGIPSQTVNTSYVLDHGRVNEQVMEPPCVCCQASVRVPSEQDLPDTLKDTGGYPRAKPLVHRRS